MYAVEYSTLEIVKRLLSLRDSDGNMLVDVNALDVGENNALMIAIEGQDLEKTKLLIDYNSDIFKKNRLGVNAVDLAEMSENKEIREIVLKQKQNSLNEQLIIAVEDNNVKDLEFYLYSKQLKNRANINYQVQPNLNPDTQRGVFGDGATPLMFAITHGSSNAFDFLLNQHGIDLNIKNNAGYDAFFYTVIFNRPKMLMKLLKIKDDAGNMIINVNEKMPDGRTALMFASFFGWFDIVKKLLEVPGIKIDDESEWKENALTNAVTGNHPDILRKLIQHGVDLSSRGRIGNTVLIDDNVLSRPNILNVFLSEMNTAKDLYAKKFHKYILGLLRSADPTIRLRSYEDVQHNIERVTQIINIIGLDINDQKNDRGLTALIQAVSGGYKKSVELLLKQKDIQVFRKDAFGHSALWYAVVRGYEDLTEMLLERYDSQKLATEIDEMDSEGDTLWNNICREYNWDIAGLILNYLPEDIKEQKMSILKRSRQQVVNVIESVIRSTIQKPEQVLKPAQTAIAMSAEEKNRRINVGFKENIDKAIKYFNIMSSAKEGSDSKVHESYDKCINDIRVILKAKDNNEHRIVNIDLINEAALSASANGCLEILEPLITYESSIIDVKDDEGNSLLMLAAKNGHLDIIPKLMNWYKSANKNSVDNSYEKFLNKTNKHNYTALMLAAENGHEVVVKTLVEKYKVKSRDAKQASDVAQSQIRDLNKKNQDGSKNEIISSYKSIKNILDIRKEEAKKNEELGIEKVEEYWPIFFSNGSKKQLLSLGDDLKYIYDEVILQLSELKINACPSTKKIEKLASGLMAIKLNDGHKLVYDIDGDEIHIISCKDHYPKQENKRSRKDVLKGVKFDTQWTNGNFISRNETGV